MVTIASPGVASGATRAWFATSELFAPDEARFVNRACG